MVPTGVNEKYMEQYVRRGIYHIRTYVLVTYVFCEIILLLGFFGTRFLLRPLARFLSFFLFFRLEHSGNIFTSGMYILLMV